MRRTVRRAARRMAGFLAIGAGIALVGWAAVLIAGASPYFRVDRIEVSGLSYLTRDEVRAAAGVDGRTSVWAREASLLDGLVAHPMIESARVTRDLPRTLLFEIDEAEPVGLVALPLVMAVDRHGNVTWTSIPGSRFSTCRCSGSPPNGRRGCGVRACSPGRWPAWPRSLRSSSP